MIFDLDGTLLDSMYVWDNLCRDWLVLRGKKAASNLEDDLAALGLKEGALYVKKNYSLSLTPKEIIDEWRVSALIHYKMTVPLKRSIVEVARRLHKAGCSLAVATSCFPEACEAVLTRYKIRKLFSAVLYTDDFITGKTGADIWLAAAERLNVAPEECIVFEDAYHSLEGVRKAGMAFAAVFDSTCKHWNTLSEKADFIFKNE